MSLRGKFYDPLGSITSIWGGSTEFEWFWGHAASVIWGTDAFGTGPIPMPSPRVPEAISEVPQTWEELEDLHPELFEPILETRPGRVADSYPQDVSSEVHDDDDTEVTSHTWGGLARGLIGDYVGGLINPTTGLAPPQDRDAFLGPSTPGNQAATAAAMTGCDGMAWSGGTPPKGYKVVNHCGMGVLRKVRRRRRRRMLTASDASDLATIVGIVGKGQMAAQMINRR